MSRNNFPDSAEIPAERLLATAISTLRREFGLGVRKLARDAGVAAPQITRIESGQVRKPTVETLVALSRSFHRNPLPLLIVAGNISGADAKNRLSHFFTEGLEFEEEWLATKTPETLRAARELLSDDDAEENDLRRLAFDVFMAGETNETLWDDAYLAVSARGEGSRLLQEMLAIWPSVSPERQQRIVEFVRDQVDLSTVEYRRQINDLRSTEAPLEPTENRR